MSSEHLRERAYQYLSEQIVSGALPAGSQVSELSLAKAIGISRTPVREAIRRLVHEGLLEQKPRFGTLVRSPDRQDIVEVFEEREALEGYAAGLAAERISDDDLARLERLCAEMARQAEALDSSGSTLGADALHRFLTADMGFHLLLLRAAGNRRIMKIVAESRMLSRVFGTPRQEHNRTVVAETCKHHDRVLRALKRRDAVAAQRCLIEHIHASKERALAHYDRTQAQRNAIPLGLPPALLTELDRIEQGLSTNAPAAKPKRRA